MGQTWSPSRREAVSGAAAALMLGAAPARAAGELDQRPSLKERGKSGTAFGLSEVASIVGQSRPLYERILAECNIFSPGNQFNWAAMERSPGVYNDADLKGLLQGAKVRQVGTIGHTLLWYHTVPAWLKQIDDKAALYAHIDSFVRRMVDNYRGLAMSWHVVNEQIRPGDKQEIGLRRSFFYEKLGFDYIKRSYQVARETDGKVDLVYNEYGIEDRGDESRRKRAFLLELLRRIRTENIEVDTLGLQSHLDAALPLDTDGLASFLREVKKLGFKIAITELDVLDKALPADIGERDRLVAAYAGDYLDCVTAEMKPTSITCWGYNDGRTWLTMFNKRSDGLPMRPLPYADDFSRKPLWETVGRFIG